nr:unnamed protein product [Digitaria exilis]
MTLSPSENISGIIARWDGDTLVGTRTVRVPSSVTARDFSSRREAGGSSQPGDARARRSQLAMLDSQPAMAGPIRHADVDMSSPRALVPFQSRPLPGLAPAPSQPSLSRGITSQRLDGASSAAIGEGGHRDGARPHAQPHKCKEPRLHLRARAAPREAHVRGQCRRHPATPTGRPPPLSALDRTSRSMASDNPRRGIEARNRWSKSEHPHLTDDDGGHMLRERRSARRDGHLT